MIGIASFGVYIPKYRLSKETAGWGRAEKAVANFDEDSITMGVAAGQECIRGLDRSQVDALFFATTSPPYMDQQGAAIVAEALDLDHSVFTSDITNVARAGTVALRSAIDAVLAGSARQAMVVAADCRVTLPRSDNEPNWGDGAVAILVAPGDGIASVQCSESTSEFMLDTWQAAGDTFSRSWESRFVNEEGYGRLVSKVTGQLFKREGLKTSDFARVCLAAPDRRRHAELGRSLGWQPEQLQDPLFGSVGNTGAAHSLMMLASALESVRAGDRILVVGYGDGADAYAFQVAQSVEKARGGRSIKAFIGSKAAVPTYETYARWRNVWANAGTARPAPPAPSITALWRERDQNIRLYGSRCTHCSYVQYPPHRVCTRCQSVDNSTPIRLAEQPGTVFTYTLDYLAGGADDPDVVCIVNFQGGGRMMGVMTDRDPKEVKIGLPVVMTFRKLRTVAGIHNYYWKFMPVRLV